MSSGLSKYAQKLSMRRRADSGAANPMPIPFHWDYHPSHEIVVNTWREDANKWMPHEFRNKKQVEFFRRPLRG